MDIENFLQEKMCSLDKATYKKFLYNKVIYHWHELVSENISNQVKPIKIERGILFVEVRNSSFKDQLKFLSEEIIDAINGKFGREEPLVTEIKISPVFQIAAPPPDKNSTPAQVDEPKIKLEDITLTPEEIQNCREQSEKISDEDFRRKTFQLFLKRAKAIKFQLANGWHKCLKCETLCEKEEILCELCKIKAHEAMVNTLFNIFYDEPWLKPWEVQKILLEKMPHMKDECRLSTVESARTSLIQNIASKVQLGDEESSDVLKLVALEKRLPPEKITPAIIRRTLIDLQFNLAEQPKIQRYKAAFKYRK